MRISDLSRAADAPIPTIKYYIREGLLPAGEHTSVNQARYCDEQVQLLKLIRVLVEPGGLSISGVKEILRVTDDDDVYSVILAVQRAMLGSSNRDDEEWLAARESVDGFLTELGWDIAPATPARDALTDVLAALRILSGDLTADECFGAYAVHATELASADIARLEAAAATSRHDVMVTLTRLVVSESAVRALRLLAREHVAHSAVDDKSRDGRQG